MTLSRDNAIVVLNQSLSHYLQSVYITTPVLKKFTPRRFFSRGVLFAAAHGGLAVDIAAAPKVTNYALSSQKRFYQFDLLISKRKC